MESTQLRYSLSLVLVLYWDDLRSLFSILRRSWPCFAILDVAACSTVIVDSATEVGELFCCWTIFYVHFDRRGIWDIQHNHICFPLADNQAYLLCRHAEADGLLLHFSVCDQH